ncbi:MAG: alpha/beta fold hydrolase [Parvibaculaceae bacterium]
MAAFLLVHGAWHDERCWELLVPALTAHGHTVHTVTLPGHGHKALSPFKVSLKGYADAVCEAAEQIAEPLVLVGHSMGGMVISKAAEARPDLFRHLVYVTAYVPRLNHWTRLRQLALRDQETQLWRGVRTDWLRFCVDLLPQHAAELFYHDCPQEIADRAVHRLGCQAGRPLVEYARITEAGAGSLGKTYVECLQDRVISLALQRRMQSHVPFERVFSLDTSHSPFLSQPHQLAGLLHTVAAPALSNPDQPERQAPEKRPQKAPYGPLAEARTA